MELFALACRVALAAVFARERRAKAVDRAGMRQTLSSFRVPRPGCGPLSWWGCRSPSSAPQPRCACLLRPVSACGWLQPCSSSSTATVVRALQAGLAPPCQCFGRIGSSRMSTWTLGRNAVLLLLVAGSWTAGTTGPSTVVMTVLAIAVGAVLAGAVLVAEQRHATAEAADQATTDSAPLVAGHHAGDFVLGTLDGRQRPWWRTAVPRPPHDAGLPEPDVRLLRGARP